jgi:hypothetical protein
VSLDRLMERLDRTRGDRTRCERRRGPRGTDAPARLRAGDLDMRAVACVAWLDRR